MYPRGACSYAFLSCNCLSDQDLYSVNNSLSLMDIDSVVYNDTSEEVKIL